MQLTVDTLDEPNSHLTVVLGEFNIKSKGYIDEKTTAEGAKIDFATSQSGFHRVTNETTHILENSLPCVGLTFTS